jgi:hypothetical protein
MIIPNMNLEFVITSVYMSIYIDLKLRPGETIDSIMNRIGVDESEVSPIQEGVMRQCRIFISCQRIKELTDNGIIQREDIIYTSCKLASKSHCAIL